MSKRKEPADHRTRVGKERSARTVTRILEAALRVFADMGPDAPKIDDFVQAAGVARGTFYNHFESVEELLDATSAWTTRNLIGSIEESLQGIEGPVLRFGLGIRLVFAWAQTNAVWCRFVARVWKVGGIELPTADIEEGVRIGVFRAPSIDAARAVLFGAVREALLRIGTERTPETYGAQVTEMLLQALGVDARRIAAVMKRDLPELPELAEGQLQRRARTA